MPIDLSVTYKDGSKELFYLSMNELMGNKPAEDVTTPRIVLDVWPWVNPTYTLLINRKVTDIDSIEIDPTLRMADINRKNNRIMPNDLKPYKDPTR